MYVLDRLDENGGVYDHKIKKVATTGSKKQI